MSTLARAHPGSEKSKTMVVKPQSTQQDAAVSADLDVARDLVKDLPLKFCQLGAKPEEAVGLAEAVSFYLTQQPNYEQLAREALARSGYKNGSIRLLLEDIDGIVRAARAG
jgi:hypothetical protein